MKKIISLSGLIGSGKDTVAEILVASHGFKRLSFSAALKDAVAAIFGWDRTLLEGLTPEARAWRENEDIWWTDHLDFGIQITPRWVLQYIGTEVMRDHFDTNIWVLALIKKIQDSEQNVVISDARFLNEMQAVKAAGGINVGVYRKLPNWLEKFYQKTEAYMQEFEGRGIMDRDYSAEHARLNTMDWGHKAVLDLKINLHESEWAHLLWNRYDHLIDNNGTLKELETKANELALQ